MSIRTVVFGLLALVGLVACGDDDGGVNNQNNVNIVVCGNGAVDPGEQCDDGVANSDLEADACRSTCRTAWCGDGVVDTGEGCDTDNFGDDTCRGLGFSAGELQCDSACQVVTDGCSTCGNGALEGDEQCDGTDLGTASCNFAGGGQHGLLRCNVDCTWDTSQCFTCGDGTIKAGVEQCEPGDVGSATCADAGYAFGELACTSPSCTLDDSGCRAFCGNGILEPGEACDGDDLPATNCPLQDPAFVGGTVSCSPSCQISVAACHRCGNGTLDPEEECEGGDLGGGTCETLIGAGATGAPTCSSTCRWDASTCSRPATSCGDGFVDPFENCDGVNLAGQTCADFAQYDGGHLACTPTCLLDTAGCRSNLLHCGNGAQEDEFGEACDGGDLGGATCATQGFGGGTLRCTGTCTLDVTACTPAAGCGNGTVDPEEHCDGAVPTGLTCADLGFVGGTLDCSPQCLLDTAGCDSCGNDTIEAGEECDGADLGGLGCADFGFASGMLSCDGCSYDTSACTQCGNGVIDAGEQCDSGLYAGRTCSTETGGTLTQGTLGCDALCQADTSGCHECGNLTAEGPEVCDTFPEAADTCQSRGYDGGTLQCTSDCMGFDEFLCEATNDGLCNHAAGERRTNSPQDCGWESIAAGESHACAIRGDGTLWCWGYNYDGQLGLGYRGGSHRQPYRVPGLENVVAVDAGMGHTCAILSDSSLWCWGGNSVGQLGDTTIQRRLDPVMVLSGVVQVAAGATHTCARLQNQLLRCWGRDTEGQLGDGQPFTGSATPVPVSSLSAAIDVAAGPNDYAVEPAHSCAVLANGEIHCWGAGGRGQLGIGSVGDFPSPVWVSALGTSGSQVATGGSFTVALLSDQTVRAWGLSSEGQLGDGGVVGQTTVPVQVVGLTGVVEVDAGQTHACARNGIGEIWCWGENAYGQLGNSSVDNYDVPVKVHLPTDTAVDLAVGTVYTDSFTCAVLADRSAWCWGGNSNGQLGAQLPSGHEEAPVQVID